jgi:hypothetical protein
MGRLAIAIALVAAAAAVVLLTRMVASTAVKARVAEQPAVTIRPATPRNPSTGKIVAQTRSVGFGSVSGRFVIDGELPDLEPIVRVHDVRDPDRETCLPDRIPNESLIVDGETGGIANIFVYLPQAIHGIHPSLESSAEKRVTCEIKECRYVPHTLIARTDQVVAVRFVDRCPHNFAERARRNAWFQDNPFPAPGEHEIERRHKSPESAPVQVVCDLHTWMSGWWLILDHPYAAISDSQGNFSIHDLPVGTYDFSIWQERSEFISRALKITIVDGETTELGEIRVPAKIFDFERKSP